MKIRLELKIKPEIVTKATSKPPKAPSKPPQREAFLAAETTPWQKETKGGFPEGAGAYFGRARLLFWKS